MEESKERKGEDETLLGDAAADQVFDSTGTTLCVYVCIYMYVCGRACACVLIGKMASILSCCKVAVLF